MNELISMLVSLFSLFSTAEPPRDALMHFVIDHLFNPDQPQLNTQSYFDQMGPFVFVYSVSLLCELIYRIFKMARGEDSSYHIKQYGISLGFLTLLAASLPGMLLATQKGVSELCKWIALDLAGSQDTKALYDALSPLTGNGIVDFGLGAVEIVFLLIFATAIVLIPLFLAVSMPLMLLGVGFRWWGDFGANILRFSLSVTLYALCGSGIYLLVLALCEAAAKTWSRNQFGQGLFNVGVIVFTTFVTLKLMSLLKDKLKAVVSGAVSTLNKTKGAIQSGVDRVRGTKDQIRDAISARTSRSSNGALATATASKFKPAASATMTGKEDVSVTEQEQILKSQLSTTASRSRHRLTAPQPASRRAAVGKLSAAAATVAATKSPSAVVAAAQAAKEVVKPKPQPELQPSPPVRAESPLPAKPIAPPHPLKAPASTPALPPVARRGDPRPRPTHRPSSAPPPAQPSAPPPQPLRPPTSTPATPPVARRGGPRPRPNDPTDPKRR